MTPQYLTGADYAPAPKVDKDFISRCTLAPAMPKLLLVGDSFAQVIARHLALAASSIGYEFKSIYGYGCPYPLPFSGLKSQSRKACSDVDEDLLNKEIVEGLRPGDLVVIRLHYAKPQYLRYPKSGRPPVDAYDAALLEFAGKIRSKGAQLLIIGSNPVLTQDEIMLLKPQWFQFATKSEQKHAVDRESCYYLELDRHLRTVFAGQSGLHYFSTAEYFCGTEVCRLRLRGRAAYADSEHINDFAIDLFFPDLLATLKAAGPRALSKADVRN